jgi:hypothetical protein
VRVCFRQGATTVGVEVEPEGLVASVRRLFQPLLDDGAPSSQVLGVRALDGDRFLISAAADEEGARQVYETVPELLAALEHAVLVLLLPAHAAEVHLHAAGAVCEAGAIIALGASGAGKSSMALAWSQSGLPLMADDTVILGEEGRVWGIPRLVKVDRGRLEPFGLTLDETVAPDPTHEEAWYDPARGGGWADARGHELLVGARIQYDGGERTRVQRMTEVESLRALLDHVLEGGVGPAQGIDRLIVLARAVPFYDVRFSDVGEAADGLRRLAEGGVA